MSPSLAQQKEGRGKQFVEEKKETTINHEGRKFQANSQLKGKIFKKWQIKDIVIVLRIREGWEEKERLVKSGKNKCGSRCNS